MKPIQPQRDSLEGKFWRRVTKGPGCWEWTGSTTSSGYGNFSHFKRYYYGHRVSYEIHVCPVPDGMVIDHLCHNRTCTNPDHLRAVPQQWNAQNHIGTSKRNTSGVRGVHWSKHRQCWVVQGRLNGKSVYVGGYPTLEEASAVAQKWRSENYPGAMEDIEEAA